MGTHVIVAQNAKGARVEAVLYERVRFPPGYTEARKKVDSVCVVMGRGWKKALIEAVVARAFSAQEEYDTKIAARAARATKRK